MLLLRDFLRFAASDAADTSTVAFSFSPALLDGERPLSDLRALLVAGSVTSPCGGMAVAQLLASHATGSKRQELRGRFTIAQDRFSALAGCLSSSLYQKLISTRVLLLIDATMMVGKLGSIATLSLATVNKRLKVGRIRQMESGCCGDSHVYHPLSQSMRSEDLITVLHTSGGWYCRCLFFFFFITFIRMIGE